MTAGWPFCVGVDGCKAGWIAVRLGDGGEAPQVAIHATFAEVLALSADAVVAVDMPIGLPARIRAGGRGPERAIRPLLGARQSSVFAIPARSAVYAADYASACVAALATSEPPRKVSRQAFHLFPKIREIEAVMDRELEKRVFEVHPELAFWRLNGDRSLDQPKKLRSRVHPPGMAERQRLLAAHGFAPDFLAQPPQRGAAADDFLDACACAAIARRIAAGLARPFPDPPLVTECGARLAIWA